MTTVRIFNGADVLKIYGIWQDGAARGEADMSWALPAPPRLQRPRPPPPPPGSWPIGRPPSVDIPGRCAHADEPLQLLLLHNLLNQY